jgi:hypothetical protein
VSSSKSGTVSLPSKSGWPVSLLSNSGWRVPRRHSKQTAKYRYTILLGVVLALFWTVVNVLQSCMVYCVEPVYTVHV